MSSDEGSCRSPVLPKDSDHGSSVSSDFQDEYDELLRYAVVTPRFGPHFLREHQMTAEQTACDRFSNPGEAAQEQTPEISRTPSPADSAQNSLREVQQRNSATSSANGHVSASRNQAEQVELPRSLLASGLEAFSPVHSEDMIFHGPSSSSSSRSQTEQVRVTELPVSAENMQQVEDLLDLWSGNLKTNVMAELSKWKLTIIEQHKLEMRHQSEKHAEHVTLLSNQIDNLQGLLQTYETSIRRKDEVISNLTRALDKHKEKVELMRGFTHWRLQQIEAKQEGYALSVADRHYRRALLRNTWRAWHSAVETNWKDKVEQACRARAEEVCVTLSNDYEAKVAQLNGALEEAHTEMQRLHVERGQYEESLKKAFMRGVCALNIEAMSMFQGREGHTENVDPSARREEPSSSVTFQQPPASAHMVSFQHDGPSPVQISAVPSEQNFRPNFGQSSAFQPKDDGSTPIVFSATPSGSTILSSSKLPITRVVTSGQQKSGRTITARVTARCDLAQKISKSGGMVPSIGVSPPMSSIVVEKHHPVTQQTIAQATAAKYPRAAMQSSASGRGTGPRTSQVQGGIHSIKVVD